MQEREILSKTGTVSEMKINSRICAKLFPAEKHNPITTGELLFVTRIARLSCLSEKEISAIGNWWLWVRNLFIQNTMTKLMEKTLAGLAINAVANNQPIHFASARSPELVHAQLPNQGDHSLPRSRAALETFSNIIKESNKFIPTVGTVFLADVAIDNIEEIQKKCSCLEEIIVQNILKLKSIITEENLFPNINIIRMSTLVLPNKQLVGNLVNIDGSINIPIIFSNHAEQLIQIATKESAISHQRMFGWDENKSKSHNLNLAKTMALVGQAVKNMNPPAILIHNESFISRGALNNLLNDSKNPLPIICLNTLLEKKSLQ